MDFTNEKETVASLISSSISQRTRAKRTLHTGVFPDKLLKLESQKRKSKEDNVSHKMRIDKVLKQSKEVQPSSPSLFPTLVKVMVPSNVAGSFWLSLPKNFAKLHLPKKDVTLTLEDDGGKEYDVKYLCTQAALSAGWKAFSIAHKLSKGDRLVFQLVKTLKFKVQIIRLNDLDEDNGALNLVSSDSSFRKANPAKDRKRNADKHCEDFEVEIIEVNSQKDEFKNSASTADHNEDYFNRLMMEDEDIMVLPHKLRRLKSNIEVLKQAKEVQPSAPEFLPTFVKIMVRSNVAGSFWLHLPHTFCDSHLPKEDVIMTLEDDDGVEYSVKYLQATTALSGGWRSFSIAHNLSKGDKVVFQLVKPLKFKVHIIRLEDPDEANRASNLVMSDSSSKKVKSAKDLRISKRMVDKHCTDLEVEVIGVRLRKSTSTNFEDVHIIRLDKSSEAEETSSLEMSDSSFKEVKQANLGVSKKKPDKHREDLEVEIIEDHTQEDELKNSASNIDHVRKVDDNIIFSLPDVADGVSVQKCTGANFEDVRSIEDFVIVVHDVVIDSALPEHVRTKYYELCCSQKSYLHIHLLKSLDNLLLSAGITSETVMMLSVGIISAVVDIADAIRATTVTALPENFTIWEQNLKQFEKLGMNVGFLLERVIQLKDLTQKIKRCWEVESKRIKAEENQWILESRILELKEEINKLNSEVLTLNPNGEDLELTFKEVANAAW